MATTAAQRLATETTLAAPALSVYGALLLRGALAAASGEDRATTAELLEEAQSAADRLGRDDNQRWTGFGPTNVVLHHVSAATRLGDAGAALAHARLVPITSVDLAERRASLFIDVAGACAQWGKYEKAYDALRAAEREAPEEVRTRPTVARLLLRLADQAPPSIRRHAHQFATELGVVGP